MTFNQTEQRMLNGIKSGKLIACPYGKYFLVFVAEYANKTRKENALSYNEAENLLLQEKVSLGEDK